MTRHAALLGTTASGKTEFAIALAERRGDVEIVSVDSMAVYRGMDIGTAKPSVAERRGVPHHLIDVVEPDEEFTVARYVDEVGAAIEGIELRGRRALLVGGTGLYVRAVVDGLEIPGRYPDVLCTLRQEPDTLALHRRLGELDPTAAARMEPSNRRRVLRALEVTVGSGRPFSSFGPGLDRYPTSRYRLIGLTLERDEIDRRIVARYERQVAAGFVDEVRRLSARGLSRTARQALGYREILSHIEDGVPLDEAIDVAIRRTRRFARRQERWFRRDPRIRWVDAERNPDAVIDDLLREWVR